MSTPELRQWWRKLGLDSRHCWTDRSRMVTRKIDSWNWTVYMQSGAECRSCGRLVWW